MAAGGLQYQDTGQEWCAESAIYEDLAVGIPMNVKSGKPITITAVQSSRHGHIELVDAYAMPVDAEDRLGTAPWPLEAKWSSDWKRASKAVGATVRHDQSVDLVLHARRTSSSGGTLEDIEIQYEQDGRTFDAATYTSVKIAAACD